MDRPNIAVIGTGGFGQRHIKALAENPGANLIAIASLEEQALADLCRRFGIPRHFTDVDKLLELPELDGVVIATTEETHYPLTKKAVERGKHVLLEKPVCLDLAEGRALAELAAAAPVHILPGHILRHDALYCQARGAVARGGTVHSIRVKRNIPIANLGFHARTHSVFMSLAHDIDVIVWLTGSRAKKVHAVAKKTKPVLKYPDIVFAVVEMANGTVCSLETQWRLPSELGLHLESELDVMTEKGRFTLNYPGTTAVGMFDGQLEQHDPTLWPEVNGLTGGALAAEVRHFADLAAGRVERQAVTVDEAVTGIEMALMIIESAETGKTVEA